MRWIGRQPYAYEDIYFHPDFFPNVGREFYTKGLSQMAAESGYPDLKVYEDVEALLCPAQHRPAAQGGNRFGHSADQELTSHLQIG